MKDNEIVFGQPLITVITLSYNSEYLLESVKSVLSQNYPKIQYLIVDDGSPRFERDLILSYIETHKAKNLLSCTITVNEKNLGTVKAFNIALRQAEGIYIFNLAGDDVFYDDHVLEEWTAEFIRRGSHCMMGKLVVYDRQLVQKTGVLPRKKDADLLVNGDTGKIFEALTRQNFVVGCGVARSRNSIDQFGYFDENFFLLEDYPYALRLIRMGGRIDYWDRPVVKYRKGGVSEATNFNAVYQKDSDLNFYKEILPYTKYPFLARGRYFWWKINRIESGSFSREQEKIYAEGKCQRIPMLYIRHPLSALRRIRDRLRRCLKQK